MSFSYNSFVKFHGKINIWEPHQCDHDYHSAVQSLYNTVFEEWAVLQVNHVIK